MIFWFFVWLYGWFVPVPVYIPPPPPPPVVQQWQAPCNYNGCVITYPPCRVLSPTLSVCA